MERGKPAAGDVSKPAKGLFLYTQYKQVVPGEDVKVAIAEKIKEESFYEPFADWLINELEGCTKAIPVGGNKFKDKWGTPDVVGVREPKKSDIIEFLTEIVCAEIKLDSSGLITAFGQACA